MFESGRINASNLRGSNILIQLRLMTRFTWRGWFVRLFAGRESQAHRRVLPVPQKLSHGRGRENSKLFALNVCSPISDELCEIFWVTPEWCPNEDAVSWQRPQTQTFQPLCSQWKWRGGGENGDTTQDKRKQGSKGNRERVEGEKEDRAEERFEWRLQRSCWSGCGERAPTESAPAQRGTLAGWNPETGLWDFCPCLRRDDLFSPLPSWLKSRNPHVCTLARQWCFLTKQQPATGSIVQRIGRMWITCDLWIIHQSLHHLQWIGYSHNLSCVKFVSCLSSSICVHTLVSYWLMFTDLDPPPKKKKKIRDPPIGNQ